MGLDLPAFVVRCEEFASNRYWHVTCQMQGETLLSFSLFVTLAFENFQKRLQKDSGCFSRETAGSCWDCSTNN